MYLGILSPLVPQITLPPSNRPAEYIARRDQHSPNLPSREQSRRAPVNRSASLVGLSPLHTLCEMSRPGRQRAGAAPRSFSAGWRAGRDPAALSLAAQLALPLTSRVRGAVADLGATARVVQFGGRSEHDYVCVLEEGFEHDSLQRGQRMRGGRRLSTEKGFKDVPWLRPFPDQRRPCA